LKVYQLLFPEVSMRASQEEKRTNQQLFFLCAVTCSTTYDTYSYLLALVPICPTSTLCEVSECFNKRVLQEEKPPVACFKEGLCGTWWFYHRSTYGDQHTPNATLALSCSTSCIVLVTSQTIPYHHTKRKDRTTCVLSWWELSICIELGISNMCEQQDKQATRGNIKEIYGSQYTNFELCSIPNYT
jgi:hypothetical protein